MVVGNVKESDNFKRIYRKLDKTIRERVDKILAKIIKNPEIGKPMKYARKGTKELYIPPFRFSYAYSPKEDLVYILDLYHKDEQ